MYFFIECFKVSYLILSKSSIPFRKDLLILFFLIFLQQVHIFLDMDTENVFSVFFWIECGLFFTFLNNFSLLSSSSLSFFYMWSWESFAIMRNMDTTIYGSLKSSKCSIASSSSNQSYIQNGFKRSSFLNLVLFIDIKDFTISTLNSFV